MTSEQSAELQRAQLIHWSRLSYAQRIAWLWDAKMFAQRAMDAAAARALGETQGRAPRSVRGH